MCGSHTSDKLGSQNAELFKIIGHMCVSLLFKKVSGCGEHSHSTRVVLGAWCPW